MTKLQLRTVTAGICMALAMLSGAAIGAAAGEGIAAISGGSGWTGAAIGAVTGGVVGNIKGSKRRQHGVDLHRAMFGREWR